MSKTETLLSALRDIQEPAAPESISLWLIAVNIALLVLLVALYFIRRNRLREGWRREARRQIQRAKKTDSQQGILLLAKLLRKIAIHRNINQANLQGDAWLEELDKLFSTQWFTSEDGRIFGDSLYKNTTVSTADLNTTGNKILQLVNALPVKAQLPAIQS